MLVASWREPVTIFCPNCGKPNTDTATQCVACNTPLKPKTAGSRFKGTMMMTGVVADDELDMFLSPEWFRTSLVDIFWKPPMYIANTD